MKTCLSLLLTVASLIISSCAASAQQSSYKNYSKKGPDAVSGFVLNGQRDSTWKFYFQNVLVAKGNYKAGKKTGVWTGYTRGYERLKYDFDKNEILHYVPILADSALVFKSINGETISQNPIYINGMQTIGRVLSKTIRYPTDALRAGQEGEVIVIITMGEDGVIKDYRFKQRAKFGLDDAALKGLKSIDGEWTPAKAGNKLVAVEFEISVLFDLEPFSTELPKPNQVVIAAGTM